MRDDVRQLTYGIRDEGSDIRAENVGLNSQGCPECDVIHPGSELPVARLSLRVPGDHNLRNALAVLAVIEELGLDLAEAARALSLYQGSGRRFELRGEVGEITVIDDYAHHPTEIRATLAAARSRYPGRRIWAVWQPHTYSRTRALFHTFTVCFRDADQVIVTEIYPAREPREDFSSAEIVAAMHHPSVQYAEDLNQAAAQLLDSLRPGDVVIVLSAGDADKISSAVLSGLKERLGQNAG
jgi:UDP-N-acetylmuramate--alanine ligase